VISPNTTLCCGVVDYHPATNSSQLATVTKRHKTSSEIKTTVESLFPQKQSIRTLLSLDRKKVKKQKTHKKLITINRNSHMLLLSTKCLLYSQIKTTDKNGSKTVVFHTIKVEVSSLSLFSTSGVKII